MELKTIVAIGLVVLFVGVFFFLKIIVNNKTRPWAAKRPPIYIPEKTKGGLFYGSFL